MNFGRDTEYLDALWATYRKANDPNGNFYRERVKLLFFAGLNNPGEVDITGINRGGVLNEIIGKVPYLNGGLFEEEPDEKDPAITVPDTAMSAILKDLFAHCNFTVTESTPLDVEVAVDPEVGEGL